MLDFGAALFGITQISWEPKGTERNFTTTAVALSKRVALLNDS